MSTVFDAEPAPLHQDELGDIRIGDSRVLLDLVVHAFQDGATPESIVQSYPTLKLVDVYGAISYYLRHQDDVDHYLCEREQRAGKVRRSFEAQQGDMSEIRARLLARQENGKSGDAKTAE